MNDLPDDLPILHPDLDDLIGKKSSLLINPHDEKIVYLETRIKKLEKICLELNPYETITDELKMQLLDFNIVDLSDPFKITNTLLMLLEDSIDELHLIKPFHE